MKPLLLLVLTFVALAADAQWQILDSHTSADLRGIDYVGNGVAWASGANGTILRTEDGGDVWKLCAIPPGGGDLDFSSIQGFSAATAVAMSSGTGELSRLYKTTDSCQTWTKVLDNPNPAGSFDALRRVSAFQMYLLADPMNGRFAVFESPDAGNTWTLSDDPGLAVPKGAGAFVAGSQSLTNIASEIVFGTSGPGASVYTHSPICKDKCALAWVGKGAPLAQTSTKAGVFSVAGRNLMVQSRAVVTGIGTEPATALVAVGGDPEKPDQGNGSAAFSGDDGATWKPSVTPPNGFRSAVDFDGDGDRFIAVGPNGTDETVDEGLIWQALEPGPGDAPGADKHWTSLSLPFAVGPRGRIGRIKSAPKALQTPK